MLIQTFVINQVTSTKVLVVLENITYKVSSPMTYLAANVLDQWPMLCTRLSTQKANSPVDVFANLLASKPDDVKDCLVLVDLMTLSSSTAKCERSFSAMNQLKSNVRTRIPQEAW